MWVILTAVVNFTNVLCAAFTHTDPKSAKTKEAHKILDQTLPSFTTTFTSGLATEFPVSNFRSG